MLPATRRTARERALELLYEAEIKSLTISEVLAGLPVAPDPFTTALLRGIESRLLSHDEAIRQRLRSGWTLERLPTIDRLVLRLGVEELGNQPETPTAVVLDEYVRLAKGFSNEESGRFVNGVLAAVARSVRAEAPIGAVGTDSDDGVPVVDHGTQTASQAVVPAGIGFDEEPITGLGS